MKLADLTFSAADCCSIHETTTVVLASGDEAGIIRGDDDIYSVTIYRNGGLWRRECCVSAERTEALLNGAE